jgi:hypothetical protein
MLFYSQTRGDVTNDEGEVISSGWYAGGNMGASPAAVNNPAYQYERDVGPLPQGVYTMSPLHTVPRIGPCIALTPNDLAVMHGRGGMLLHCDNRSRSPQSSSEGCAVAPTLLELKKVEALRASGQYQLEVTV